MLTHIVFIKFPDQSLAAEARRRLLSMEGKIPSLLSIEAGLDVTRSGRSWDLALLTRFADQAGLDEYAVHPVHQEVLTFIREHASGSAAVDYIDP